MVTVIERSNKPSDLGFENPPRQYADEEPSETSIYEAIAELLRKARASCARAGDEPLVYMVDAAYRISRACRCATDEVEWHRQAYSKAHHRQLQLFQELSAFIDLISAPAARNKEGRRDLLSPALAGQDQSVNPVPAEYDRLVQCIKDLLEPSPVSEPVPQMTSPQAENVDERVLSQAAEVDPAPPGPLTTEADDSASLTHHSLAIYFLSPFRVLLDEQPVVGWPNGKGKSIFKYLVTHRERPIQKEVLMEIFWPEGDPEAARNNLNVAIYGLRKALNKANTDFPYVLFQEGCYRLNPELQVWVDADDFMAHVRKAKECERRSDQAAAIREYRAAEAIYQSEFLIEDRYEDWLIEVRQNFQDTYLAVMNRLSSHYFEQQDYEACVTICAKALAQDSCNEELHRRLMRCYSLMGYTHLALRQFHVCRETLARELNLTPSQETMQLFEQIRQRQSV